MPRPFARHYDAIYADKDYGADVAAFESLAGAGAGRKLLEIGAGTGNHTLRLAARAGRLVSIEVDADFGEILERKVAGAATVFLGPLQRLEESDFDAAAAFFHVLNYIRGDELPSFLDALAARLKPGAPFVTDLWNAAAVATDPPRAVIRRKPRVVQEIFPVVDGRRVTLRYKVTVDGEAFEEQLVLHMWPMEELEAMLKKAGFRDVVFRDYRDCGAAATQGSWKLWLRAVRGAW